MSTSPDPELRRLLQLLVEQQTAMLQVQAESLRVQRLLVEHVLGAASDGPRPAVDVDPPPRATSTAPPPPSSSFSPAPPATDVPADLAVSVSDRPPPGATEPPARAARYYQPRPVSAAKIVPPEEMELLRRLQEMRDDGDLILQFGPHKGTTLAQVAMRHPEYIRELMTRAQRPEVRAAAARLVDALDAAAEHRHRPARHARA